MAWTPYWSARFAKPLVNQIIAVIQRDQAAALAYVNAERAALGNAALPPIQEFHKGAMLRTALPWLTVAYLGSAFDPDQDLQRASTVRISLVLDVGQYDQDLAQDAASDYAEMLDQIVMTAGAQGMNTAWESVLPIFHITVPLGNTSPPNAGTVKRVIVEAHQFARGSVTVQTIDTPIFQVTLPLLFELKEQETQP